MGWMDLWNIINYLWSCEHSFNANFCNHCLVSKYSGETTKMRTPWILFIKILIFYSIEGAFIFLLECPFVTKCLRNTDRLIEMGKDNRIKCGVYVV